MGAVLEHLLRPTPSKRAAAIRVKKSGRHMRRYHGLSVEGRMLNNVSANTMESGWMNNGERAAA